MALYPGQVLHCTSPYCPLTFASQRGRTTHIRSVHGLLEFPAQHSPHPASTPPTQSPPTSPQLPSLSTPPIHSPPTSPRLPNSPAPPHDVAGNCHCQRLRKQTHPYCDGRATDADGNMLPDATPPPLRCDLPPNDWTPFSSGVEFLLADFLFRKVQMSASNINELLKYWAQSVTQDETLSPFDSCHSLYATIDAIRDGDAPWQCMTVSAATDDLSEDVPLWKRQDFEVWYRDPDVVIANLLDNPDFASQFDAAPYIATDSQGKRRWTDFMSGQFAWRRSDMIYNVDHTTEGAMYCAVVLGSDKTTVSVATGHVEYHPLYLSIGNIHNEARRGHRHGVVPIAFLAIPKYDESPEFRRFKRRLYHTSISAVLESLRPGMTTPVVRRCPDGHYRRVVYDIGPFIADYPEQVMLSGIVQGWCARCTAKSRNLDGEAGRRTRTLSDLLRTTAPISSAELRGTYGIDDDIIPFTNDFPRADIHESLSPDLLHQIIKGCFKDHLVSWVGDYIKAAYGKSRAEEILDDIDRRIALTPPFPGLRRFKHGRRFKQWTGDDSKALMKVYLPSITEYCLSAFLDFCYIVRRSEIGESDLATLTKVLTKFHTSREVFRTAGVRPKGFNLPRQHSMMHYVHLIQEFGAPSGLCSSITESRHITAVKKPWRRSNRYEPLGQMLVTNQRLDKLVAAHTNYVSRNMLPPERDSAATPSTTRTTQEDRDGAVDGSVDGEVALIVRSLTKTDPLERGYPSDLTSLAEYLGLSPAILPNIHTNVGVFHSARAVFHAPSDVSGTHGMQRQMIRATPSWRQKEARYDCVLIVEDDRPGMRGMVVGRVRSFFSFTYDDVNYPCALIDRFRRVGRCPDPVTGMWRVQPEVTNSRRVQSVVHIETILRNVHLIPVFGKGFIPHNLHFSDSLDIFSMYYVNKYADHHSFEVVI
ncbi:hypothetical protein EDB85DRAFT_2076211 [Lactarius pseudohatsudake]|nr:hypothetical protein EDB85DRAFT_2076211 [Lactarius pseudohatsudake]